MRLSSILLTLTALTTLPLPAAAAEHEAPSAEHHHQELIFDIGADREEGETLATVGVLYACDLIPDLRFVASGALTHSEGHLVRGGDVALGLYRVWELAGFEPELGFELGTTMGGGHEGAHASFLHPFARVGAGVFHHLAGNWSMGVATDAAVRTDHELMFRALLEMGVTL